jgi:DNA-binding NarL/FixJ family response regulator
METEPNRTEVGRSGKIRVMLVDHHALMREGIRGILACTPDIEVCAETGQAQEVIGLAQAHRPDVVVLEIDLGQDDGLELTRTLVYSRLALQVVVFTQREEILCADEAVVSGARALVGKKHAPAVLIEAIRTVAGGEYFFTGKVRQYLLGEFSERAAMRPAPRVASGWRQRNVAQSASADPDCAGLCQGGFRDRMPGLDTKENMGLKDQRDPSLCAQG